MTKTPSPDATGIDKAIAEAGSQVKLAALIGATQQMISYWKRTGIVSDTGMCAAIERATGVHCEELNPGEDWATLRIVLCAPDRDRIDASDDTQPPVGGMGEKTKEAKMAL